MATGGGAGSVLLTGSDEITIKLLSHVSLHVKPETCKQFATGPLSYEHTERQRQRQRQGHQCKSMVTLHLTLLIGPRSILERHHIHNDKDFAAAAAADAAARSVHTLTQATESTANTSSPKP